MSENSTTAADAKLHPDDFELSINDLEAEYNLEDESIFSSDEEYMKYVHICSSHHLLETYVSILNQIIR